MNLFICITHAYKDKNDITIVEIAQFKSHGEAYINFTTRVFEKFLPESEGFYDHSIKIDVVDDNMIVAYMQSKFGGDETCLKA